MLPLDGAGGCGRAATQWGGLKVCVARRLARRLSGSSRQAQRYLALRFGLSTDVDTLRRAHAAYAEFPADECCKAGILNCHISTHQLALVY